MRYFKYSISKEKLHKIEMNRAKILLTVLHVLGLVPFTIKIPNNPRRISDIRITGFSKIFLFSKIGYWYNVALSIGLISMSIPIINYYLFSHTSNISSIGKLMLFFLIILILVTNVTIWLNLISLRESLVELANQLVDVDVPLAFLSHRSHQRQWLLYLLPLLINVIGYLTSIVSDLVAEPDFYEILHSVLELILTTFLVEYATILVFIKSHFQNLNVAILQFFNLAPSQLHLVSVRRIHTNLYENCRKLDRYLSFPTFLAISYLRIYILFLVYRTTIIYIILETDLDPFSVFNVSILTFNHFYPLLILTITVSSLINETKNTNMIVQKLFSRFIADKPFQHELYQFTIDLLDRDISFRAGDVYNLDRSLLKSVTGLTITYLIILIQLYEKENYDRVITNETDIF